MLLVCCLVLNEVPQGIGLCRSRTRVVHLASPEYVADGFIVQGYWDGNLKALARDGRIVYV